MLVMNKTINYMLTAFILIVALSYIYFANVAVRTLTVLEKTKQQMQILSMEVSEMESKRLLVENNMSTEIAQQMGFVAVNNPTFIVKNSKKDTLSLKID